MKLNVAAQSRRCVAGVLEELARFGAVTASLLATDHAPDAHTLTAIEDAHERLLATVEDSLAHFRRVQILIERDARHARAA